MEKKKRAALTAEQKEELYQRYKQGGTTAADVAEEYGCCESTVWNIIGEKRKEETTGRKSQINPEFDAAVDQMIAESKAEVIPAPALPAAVPTAVLSAVRQTIAAKESEVCEMLGKIRMMQQQVEQIRTEVAQLRTWIEEVGG